MQNMQHVADKQAIAEQLYRYCRAMDRIDHALGYAVWHEDGQAEYGPFYSGSGRGFVDWVCESHRAMIAHSHQISNILITVDADTAASEAYVTAILRFQEGEQLREVAVRGRYIDQWSRRAGNWAIDRRVYVQDFDEVRDVGAIMAGGWGTRDREDPSYAALGQAPVQ